MLLRSPYSLASILNRAFNASYIIKRHIAVKKNIDLAL